MKKVLLLMGLCIMGGVLGMSLTGCVPLVIGAGALAGGIAGSAAEERGVGGSISDVEIRSSINYLWMTHDKVVHTRLNTTVREGRVLLTGTVDTEQQHLDAVKLVWQAKGVKEIIDEIKVTAKGEGFGDYSRDTWITTKLKSRMLFDKYIASRNFTVITVESVVYVMGIAQDRRELELVTDHARTISGVKRVVSYARIKAETDSTLKPTAAH